MDLHLWPVCAGTLTYGCGIKINKPVSGIAMGLISDEKDPNNYGYYQIF